jgi:endonuclease/exonuclease/phosphatase family metal-dependent hydrolase
MSVRLCSVPGCRSGYRGLIPVWSAVLAVLVGFGFAFVPDAVAQTKSLPGTIQAEDFDNGSSGNAYWDTTSGNAGGQYRSTDVDIEACSEGGYDVGWAFPGEWLNYSVNVASAGSYTLAFRVATASGGGFHLEVNGANVTGTMNVNPTGGWQSWTTVQKSVALAGGSQVMRIVFDYGNVNVNWFTATSDGGGGGAKAIPGTIQAEDFEPGANGYTYWDSTAGNSGGQYRTSDVDIEACSEGGYDVGWTTAGEWLGYTVNVASAGTYTLDFRVATPSGASLHVEFGGANLTGSISVPSTGGWQTWTSVQRTVTLPAGLQTMVVVFDTGNVNLNSLTATAGSASSAPPPSGSASPFNGVALAIPGWIQAEDFDNGDQYVAYYDNTPGNNGGAYRATDVDIASTPSGGYAVGWIGAGEWLRYTVNVASPGTYTVTARVASAGSGGTFHIEFDGGANTGAMRVPNTGSWSTYQDLTATVSLPAGTQTMWIVFDSNGSTGAVGNLSAVRFDAGSTPAPAPPPSGGGGRLRAMTWNINFGHGNPAGQAALIASVGADVVTLQEASTYDENMPSTYVSRLQQLTGQTWYSAWGPSLTSAASQGTLILSRYPIVDTSSTVLAGTGTARAAINVGGVVVQVFAVHLEYYDTSKRSQQLNALMDWARQYSGPRLVGGDFNSWWGEWWIQQMETEYSDTWELESGSVQNGYTLNGSVRFDYLFRSFAGDTRMTPTNCWVQSTSLSDHWPVIADYNIQ